MPASYTYIYVCEYPFIEIIQWALKMKAFVDWTTILWDDEMVRLIIFNVISRNSQQIRHDLGQLSYLFLILKYRVIKWEMEVGDQ